MKFKTLLATLLAGFFNYPKIMERLTLSAGLLIILLTGCELSPLDLNILEESAPQTGYEHQQQETDTTNSLTLEIDSLEVIKITID